MKPTDFKFTESFLDMAFTALIANEMTNASEHDQEIFNCICEVCAANDISVRKGIKLLTDINAKFKEKGLEDNYDQT